MNVTITRNKSLVYGRILVDDWPAFVGPWLANRPRGLAIIPAQPWNDHYWHPRAFRYTGDNFDGLKKCVAAAANRADGDRLDLSFLGR